MAQPLFFDPDPSIDDSDQLGYGNLIFDDGSNQWVNGEPDVSAMFPRAPAREGTTELNFSPAPDASTPDIPSGMEPQPIGDTGLVVDPMTGQIMPPDTGASPEQQAHADTVWQDPVKNWNAPMPQVTGEPAPAPDAAPTGGPSLMPPVPIPGTPHAVDPATGNIIQGGAAQAQAQPQSGYGSGGLQLAQREGALPQDLAAQQASERETLNTNQLIALDSSRQAEANVYRTAALERMAQLDAEKQARQAEVAEQTAKVERWKAEQTATAAVDIKTDLISAEGAIGAVFSILGAAMLGAVGSDAGLRMIESSIDQNVKKQINMRDSKLHVLADQIGSQEQAVAAGKAALYKIAADKVEATQQITKADAFEAQTPEILSGLRQKQQLFEQEQQRISLGKTLEKAPVVAQPKPNDVAKYGKAAQEQRQAEMNIDRAANALGLAGWDPESGTFQNRAEILKKGIPGAGKGDTFLQGIPGLRNIDNAATSTEGTKVRAALEALVAAEAKQQNPGRAPTDADRDAARISLGLNTEEGIVAAVERLKGQQEQTRQQNTAAYGAAAGAYEGRIDAQGARPPQQRGAVDMGQTLEPGKARQMLQQERMRPREGLDAATREATGQGPQASVDPMQEVAGEVQRVAGRELPPEGLKILVAQAAHETGDGQHAPNNNMFGHKATKGKPSASFETTEGEGAEARRMQQNFRAYDSVSESVDDHIELIRRKYPEAWAALERGDARAYAAALKDGGYYTGSETEYANGLERRL